ncbi:MAG: DUF6807 family protein [Planctomycetota bacterium]
MLRIQSSSAARVALVLAVSCVSAISVGAKDVSIDADKGVTTVTVDGKPLLEYYHQPNPTKLYVSRWFTPDEVQVLRDSPHDHVHHHALMYAIGIDEVDFWGEGAPEQYGRQVSRAYSTASTLDGSGKGEAVIKQRVDWVAPDQEALAEEARTIRAHIGVVPEASLLTWRFKLCPAKGRKSMKLWGRHYFGLGMRFVESMDGGNSTFLMAGDAEGTPVRGTEKLTPAAWCAVHGTVQGKPVTVAVFDAPNNPRHPAAWFTMTKSFAYLAATLKLHEEPLVVTNEEPLSCRYGLALWDGTIGRAGIESAYEKWLQLSGKHQLSGKQRGGVGEHLETAESSGKTIQTFPPPKQRWTR